MTNLTHAQQMFDLEQHGVEQLERALRNLPTGGTVKLAGSAVGLTRVAGGRRFALSIPPKITEPLSVKMEDLKSVQTAAPALADAHRQAVEQLERRGVA